LAVYRGREHQSLAVLAQPRKVFGFDSFEGLPETWIAGSGKGAFSLQGEAPS